MSICRCYAGTYSTRLITVAADLSESYKVLSVLMLMFVLSIFRDMSGLLAVCSRQ